MWSDLFANEVKTEVSVELFLEIMADETYYLQVICNTVKIVLLWNLSCILDRRNLLAIDDSR